MKTPFRKIEATEPVDREAALHHRLNELRVLERELTEEIIAIEARGACVGVSPSAPDLDAAAYMLLTGVSLQPVPTAARGVDAVYHEREVARRAYALGAALYEKERSDRQFAAMVARMDEWRKLIRQTAVATLELQRLNRARQQFKKEIGGQPSLPCDVAPRALLGSGDLVGDEAYRFLESVLAQGIMTRSEVEKSK